MKAEKLLAELEKVETPQAPEIDKEGITEEERFMLRKVGLRMKAFLLMGEFFHPVYFILISITVGGKFFSSKKTEG